MIEPVKTQWSKIQAMALARAFSLLGTELTIFTLVFREKDQGPAAVAALFIVGTTAMVGGIKSALEKRVEFLSAYWRAYFLLYQKLVHRSRSQIQLLVVLDQQSFARE